MIRHEKLANGIEVVTDPAPAAETLSINVSFRVGSCDEHDTPHGTAHFLEHMAFKGTSRRSAEDISNEITSRGGYLNATTDWDTTSFTCKTLKEELDHSLDVLADIVINPKLAKDDVDLERNVILQEMEQNQGTWSTLDECFYTSAYGEQDLARPIIGTEDGVRAITADALRSFMERHYVSGNMIVAVAGDVTHAEVMRLVEEKFSKLRTGPRTPMPAFEYYGGELGYACSCEQGIVKYGFVAPRFGDPAAYPASLFRAIAAIGPTSRMYRELRERQGMVYEVDGYTSHHCANSLTTFQTVGHASKIRDIFLRMHDALVAITHDLEKPELERCQRVIVACNRMQRDDVSARTSDAVFQLVAAGQLLDRQVERANYEAVTVEEVREYGRRMLASPATLAVHGPARGMPKLANLKSNSTPRRKVA